MSRRVREDRVESGHGKMTGLCVGRTGLLEMANGASQAR